MSEVITALSNPPAERMLIGLATISASAFDDAACEPADFELPEARVAWEAITALRNAGNEVTPLTIVDHVRRHHGGNALDASSLLVWAAQALPGRVASTAKIVRSAALARRLAAACSETIHRLNAQSADAEDALEAHRMAVGGMDARVGEDPISLGDALPEILDTIQARASRKHAVAVPTGLKKFDETIGGLRPKTMTVIAARPGKGKSALAKGMAWAAAGAPHEIPVLIFSLEMGIQEQGERFIGSDAGVNLGRITSGRLEYAEYKRLQGAAASASKLPIWIYDQPVRLDRMASITRRWHARHVAGKGKKLALVICDYLGLVKATAAGHNREREVAAVTGMAKELAMGLGVAMVMVSQLNRKLEQEQRDPQMSDLRESGAIEQDADMVIFPIRDEANEDNTGSGPARIVCAKNRGGPTGEIPAWWQGRFTRFVDRDDVRGEETEQ